MAEFAETPRQYDIPNILKLSLRLPIHLFKNQCSLAYEFRSSS